MENKPELHTFEKDIADEIRTKAASISDIAIASGVVENKEVPVEKKSSSKFIVLGVIAFLLILGAIGAYFFLSVEQTPQPTGTTTGTTTTSGTNEPGLPVSQNGQPGSTSTPGFIVTLSALFPNLDRERGDYITKIERIGNGYVLTLSQFNPVFGYVYSNQDTFVAELSRIFQTELATTSSTIVSIRNQDITVVGDATTTLVYGFFGTTHLGVATSTETLLELRDAILR